MCVTISKQNYRGKIFYRVKNNGVYLNDFKTKKEAVIYANTKRNIKPKKRIKRKIKDDFGCYI